MPRRKLIAVLIAIALLCAAAWPFTKAHLQALAILKQVGNQPVPWLVRKVASEPIATQDTQLPGNIRARLYTPIHHPNAPALIVLHGVHHLGMNEPRLEAFAAAMASCGLRVLTPELPGIKDYHVDASSIRVIGESAQWFAQQTGAPVGVMGLSFSGGLALVAAADPTYRPAFKFVFAVGSQDSMSRVEQYYLTGKEARPDGTIELLAPHEYGALVLEYEHLEDFVPAADIEAIRPVLASTSMKTKPPKPPPPLPSPKRSAPKSTNSSTPTPPPPAPASPPPSPCTSRRWRACPRTLT